MIEIKNGEKGMGKCNLETDCPGAGKCCLECNQLCYCNHVCRILDKDKTRAELEQQMKKCDWFEEYQTENKMKKCPLCENDIKEKETGIYKCICGYTEIIAGTKNVTTENELDNNYKKLKRIYELILHYEKEYGRNIALETIEVSNKVRTIKTIDELLEDLENNK